MRVIFSAGSPRRRSRNLYTIVAAFLVSLTVVLVLTPLVRAAAVRFGALDHALSSRKIHGRPTPRLGGMAIVAGFFAPIVALCFLDTDAGRLLWGQPRVALALIVGGLAIAALGIYDDLLGSGAGKKFSVQVLVACLMWWAGYRIDAVSTPFGSLGIGLASLPLTVLWIVGVTNAINLIDGLDGLATGIALVATATILWLSLGNGNFRMALFMACLAGALLGFLRYNFHPASIFMGDTGSLFVGFVLATTALETRQKSTTAVALLVPIVALGLPIGDTLLAMARRTIRGQPIFSSDRGHIHHRLMAQGLSHRATVLLMYGIAVVLGGVAVAIFHSSGAQTVAYIGAVGAIAAMLLFSAGYGRFSQARKLLSDRKNNLATRAKVRETGERLRQAMEPDDIWAAVRDTLPALQATSGSLSLRLRGRNAMKVEYAWRVDEGEMGSLRARFILAGERPDDGCLELRFREGIREVDRDTEIAVELLCEHVREAASRISSRWEAETSGTRKLLPFRR